MIRLLVLTHRYLGMALGMLISLWCLSGFVMMYEPYPELHDRERLAGMEPLRFEACCRQPADFGDGFGDGETGELDGFRLEMMGGTPVLRLLAGESQHVFDLRDGVLLGRLRPADARSVAATVARARGWQGTPRWTGAVAGHSAWPGDGFLAEARSTLGANPGGYFKTVFRLMEPKGSPR